MTNQELMADTSPSKRFFVEMLARDISLSDAILDLIDNSVNSLIRESEIDVSEGLQGGKAGRFPRFAAIDIRMSKERFAIEDTCGGISLDDARKHVFRFGDPVAEPSGTPALSVFGIG